MFKYSTGPPLLPSQLVSDHACMCFFWWRSPLSCARLCCTVCPTFKQLFVAVYCQRIKSVAAVGVFCLFVCLFFWAVWSHLISVEKNLFLIHGFLSHSFTNSLIYFLHWNLKQKKKKDLEAQETAAQVRSAVSAFWLGLDFFSPLIDRSSCTGEESWYQLVFLSSSSIKLQVVSKMQTRGCDGQNT